MILFLLIGFKTHIIISLVFSTLQIAVIRSSLSHLPDVQEIQRNVIILLSMGIIESITSFIQFMKAFPYEIRIDDGFVLAHLALISLSYLASYYQSKPRMIQSYVYFFFLYLAPKPDFLL